MPTFRERPLTWLFLIATACVDLAAWFGGWYESFLIQSLMMGQIMALGGWTAVSSTHRLARGGGFIAGVLALSTPDLWQTNHSVSTYGYVLTSIVVIASVTFFETIFFRFTKTLASGEDHFRSTNAWRISVVELLGWMIIVGVAVSALRRTEFQALAANPENFGGLVRIATVASSAAAMIAAALPYARWNKTTTTMATLGILAAIVQIVGYSKHEHSSSIAISLCYILGWIAVQRMDDSRRTAEQCN